MRRVITIKHLFSFNTEIPAIKLQSQDDIGFQ